MPTRPSPHDHAPRTRARSAAGYVRTLLDLELKAFTGVLWVRAEGVTTRVHFRQGTIVFASGGTVSDSLGRLLVQDGVISREAYAEAIRAMTDDVVDDELMRLGEVLVRLGHMSLEDVHEALRQQVRRKVMRCLQYDRVELVLDGRDPTAGVGQFPMRVAPVLVDAARRYVGSARAAAMLQPLRGSFLALQGEPAAIARRLELSSEQARALERIDGQHETWKLIAAMGSEGLDPVPLMVALFLADLLLPLSSPRDASPPREDARPKRPAGARFPAPSAPSVFGRQPSGAQRPDRPRPSTRTTRRTEPFPESARSQRPTWRREDLPRRQAGTHRALEPEEASPPSGASIDHEPSSPGDGEGRRMKLAAEEAYRRGMMHLWAERLPQASDSLLAASSLDPTHLEYQLCALWVRYRRAAAPDDIARLQQALKELAPRVAAQDRSLAFPPYVLAHLALLEHDEDRALRLFRVAAHRGPDNVDAARHVRLLSRRRSRTR